MAILRDKAAAEDACQQALYKAWNQPPILEDRSNLQAWMHRVVINECLAVMRRRAVERRALAVRGANRREEQAPDEAMSLREAVLGAVAQLEEPTRTIVVMRIIEERSGKDVMGFLGCSASEVSRRLHDGMEQLRPMLADWHGAKGM